MNRRSFMKISLFGIISLPSILSADTPLENTFQNSFINPEEFSENTLFFNKRKKRRKKKRFDSINLVSNTKNRKYKNQKHIANRTITKKRLRMYNSNTKESINEVFYRNGKYNEQALANIDYFMRDFREDKMVDMDVNLIELLHTLQIKGRNRLITLHSGYRTPKTNRRLRRYSKKVAKHSYHMKGKAADITIAGVNTRTLAARARHLQSGGVGQYQRAGFVHVDVGPVRRWRG